LRRVFGGVAEGIGSIDSVRIGHSWVWRAEAGKASRAAKMLARAPYAIGAAHQRLAKRAAAPEDSPFAPLLKRFAT